MTRRTALVTGTSSGIGRATVEAFLDEEWRVYATARDTDDIAALADRPRCETAELDVTVDAHVDRVVARVVDEAGRIDCLVNNAGVASFGPVEEVSVERGREQFAVNVHGVHRLTRAVLPHMRERQDGTIVNVSSVLGRVVFPGTGLYAASKHALEAMTDALRVEVADHGVDVVLVEPANVDTPFWDDTEALLPPDDERTGAYDAFYEQFGAAPLSSGDDALAIQPETVAADVVNAASATKPRARYPSGTPARGVVLLRFLPDAVRDRLFELADRLPT